MKRECNVKVVEFGSVKALVSINYGDLEIRGFKVIDHEGGNPWISMPSREYQKNGERQFFDIILFPDPEKRKEFSKWLVHEYRSALNGSSSKS